MLRLLMSFLFVLCTTICLQGCATERSSHATAGSKDAIVMDVLGPWRASRWGSYELPYAGNASIDTKDKDADPTFTVHDPSALHVWVRYGFLVDYNRYPIFVLRYRAHNLATDAWYNIWRSIFVTKNHRQTEIGCC